MTEITQSLKAERWVLLLTVLLASVIFIGYWYGRDPNAYYDELWLIAGQATVVFLSIAVRKGLVQPVLRLQQAAHSACMGSQNDEQPTFSDPALQLPFETMNNLQTRILHATEFVRAIEAGNLQVEYTVAEQATLDNNLRTALLSMRDQMQKIALEERERNWSTTGLTQFIEILRSNNQDIQQLSDHIIMSLVKYMEANQGGLFIATQPDDRKEVVLELVSCYAYSRKKYRQKEIAAGEGLVGQVYLEKKSTYLTDIPDDYLEITSGLGKATPGHLLLIPLLVNGVVYGVLEIASFQAFANYQIAFLEKLGESIASTLATVRANVDNQMMLEELKQQAEELRATEEEIRQNMEELQATQEQQERLQNELRQSEEILKSKVIELEEAQQETALVKETEMKRATEQIAKRSEMMVKVQEKFKQQEQALREQVQQQAEELAQLRK